MITTESAAKDVLLMIADISGYTRFMVSNARSLTHSQTIIAELIQTIIEQVEVPLEIAKLEGDAVFLYGIKGDAGVWQEKKAKIGEKLIAFFRAFSERVSTLTQSTHCQCNACQNIEKLKLKLIVHSGEALFHRVGKFEELAGVDVILVHRLLKNSLQSDQYILMTTQGFQDLEFPNPIGVVHGEEEYEEFGKVKVLVYYPPSTAAEARKALRHEYENLPLASKLKDSYAWDLRMWKKQIISAIAPQQDQFNHLPPGASRHEQIAFGVFSTVLSPLFVPASLLLSSARTLRQHFTRGARPAAESSSHGPDTLP